MNNEYCVIYACTDNNPMFIVAVSQDQNMINGFREEHYHFAKYGEIVNDGKYGDYYEDYEIMYKAGHYITNVMLTEFIDYLVAIYNQFSRITDVYDRNIEYLKFDENDNDIAYDGFGLLNDHLEGTHPVDYSDVIEDFGQIFNVELCLDNFMNQYEPKPVY